MIPSLAVGPFSAVGVSALAADLSRLEPHFGIKVDVVVGAGFLRGACFSIDYVGRRLRFECHDRWRATLPLDPRSPHLVADVTVDGREPVATLVDTGSQRWWSTTRRRAEAWQSRSNRNRRMGLSGPVPSPSVDRRRHCCWSHDVATAPGPHPVGRRETPVVRRRPRRARPWSVGRAVRSETDGAQFERVMQLQLG